LLKPAAQTPQSDAASNCEGHALQLPAAHWLRQEQLQPVPLVPLTAVAWLAQSAATVQTVVGAGVGAVQAGKSTRPTAHALQSAAASYLVAQMPQLVPDHLLRQVQLQPVVVSPAAADAWLLQSATVQTMPHVG
jgi:hypothetical protein